MGDYKYIHLLWGHDLKFIGPLLNLFNNSSGSIDISEHLFVTPYDYVYKDIQEYPNVIFDNSNENLYNKYFTSDIWIISHGYKSITDFFKVRKRVLNRIIFRTWGGSFVYRKRSNKNFFHNLIHKLFYYFYRKRVLCLAAIGISNYVDEFDIRQSIEKIPLYKLSYTERSRYDYIMNLNKLKCKENVINVLIGHRGSRDNNHLEILEKLKKFKDKIEIYIPLSYGDSDYIKELCSVCECKYKDYNLHLIKDFYKFEEYSKFLSTMDIAIFDGKESYALGNISLLLMFGKKIFISKDSLIAKAFDEKNVPYGKVETIEKLDFDSFLHQYLYNQSSIEPFIMNSYEGAINGWKQLFIDLDNYGNV